MLWRNQSALLVVETAFKLLKPERLRYAPLNSTQGEKLIFRRRLIGLLGEGKSVVEEESVSSGAQAVTDKLLLKE